MLKGNKVILRALEPTDLEVLYHLENDPAVWHLSTTLAPFSRFALEQYILNSADIYTNRQIRFMIETNDLPDKQQTIGALDLFEFEPVHMRAGIGIIVSEDFRGKGYASEALALLIKYAFDTLQLHQVFCNISPENVDSLNLFRSKGFKMVGIKKDWNKFNNAWCDECLFQLINNRISQE
jgi:diamine N-acetyltransferase